MSRPNIGLQWHLGAFCKIPNTLNFFFFFGMKMDEGVKLYLLTLTLLAHIRKIALYFVMSRDGLSNG